MRNSASCLGRSVAFSAIVLLPFDALAISPNLKTPEPVIFLADNLDEKDQLGWCIDTLGRGFSEQLQVHSCKPQGGDVQFYYETVSGNIVSAEFEGKCVTLANKSHEKIPFGLLNCEVGNTAQVFSYDAASMEFHPEDNESLCLTASAESRSAGPFMSRDLQFKPCAAVASELRQWIVKGVGP